MKFKLSQLPIIRNQGGMMKRKQRFLTHQELIVYEREKKVKDIKFYADVMPYVNAFFIFLIASSFVFMIVNMKYKKKGVNLYEKLKFKLLDIEEEKKLL
jgi:hypothetical protein